MISFAHFLMYDIISYYDITKQPFQPHKQLDAINHYTVVEKL